MLAKSIARRAALSLLMLGACSPSSSGGHPSSAGAAGTTGAAGTMGAAGATAGAAGTTGAAGQSPAGQGGTGEAGTNGGPAGAGGAGTTGAAGQDAAVPDAGSNGDATSPAVDGAIQHVPFKSPVKIMVLGSSNEEGTCWRAFLQKKLKDNGITDFDFVGRNNAGPACTGVTTYDKDCEAHGGTVVENISAAAWAETFKANPPDIILQHNGGADLLNGKPYMNVINAYTLSVMEARKVNPRVVYLAAQHTPQGSANDVKNVITLNSAMVPWGAGITTADSPVVIVDLFTGIDQKTDMSDGTHLNEMGSQKVADRWLALLVPMLKP